jgi:hypothetical protein
MMIGVQEREARESLVRSLAGAARRTRAPGCVGAGRPHAPRVRPDELPLKPGHGAPRLTPARGVASLRAQIVGNAIPSNGRRENGSPT